MIPVSAEIIGTPNAQGDGWNYSTKILIPTGTTHMSDNAAFDDEQDDYTAPGHTAPLVMPLALVRGASAVGLCDHTQELQSMRNAIEHLREQVEKLTAERDALKAQTNRARDGNIDDF